MRKNYWLFFLCLFCIFAIPTVDASLLGVNKISLEYTDVLRGGYAEDSLIVSTGSINNISVYYEAQGAIKDWISFNPEEQPIMMSANNPAFIGVIMQPPRDTAVGEYEGIILISTGPLGEQSGSMGTNVVVAFEIKVKVKVTDAQILICTAGGFDIKDAEIGMPLDFSATTSNGGNVRVTPLFNITVYDQDQKNIIETLNYNSINEILPTLSGEIKAKLEHKLQPGQYWANVSSPTCNSQSTITFSILEKGGISDVGDFVRIENDAWAKTGDIVPLTAQFRNRGSRTVSAQFKGTVMLDGKIIKLISSDKIDVLPNQLAGLEIFFTPKDIGQYRISGRINYNNKITYERSSILNVEEGTNVVANSNRTIYYVALLIIIILIMGLLILIIRRKRKAKKLA
ncbi:MAG: hypothetical protein WC758_04720 [Candidatus Woesearchaeota archaeon]|jgi:hypothetical protein